MWLWRLRGRREAWEEIMARRSRVGGLAGEVRMVKRAEAEYLGLTFGGEMIGCGEHVRGYWFGDGARGSSVSWTRRRAAWDGTCGRVECFGETR